VCNDSHRTRDKIPLAQVAVSVFDWPVVQLRRALRDLKQVGKPALAGLLVVLLLVVAVLSASHLLHQNLHGSSAANHPCLICAFANGQVSAVESVTILTAFVAAFLCVAALPSNPLLPSSDRRLSPSRAPPVS